MEVNDAQIEEGIQLPIKSKPIERLMDFSQRCKVQLSNRFEIDLYQTQTPVQDNSKVPRLKSDRPLSELSEYVYTADNCNYDSKMEDDHKFPTDEIYDKQHAHQQTVKETNKKDKQIQFTSDEVN